MKRKSIDLEFTIHNRDPFKTLTSLLPYLLARGVPWLVWPAGSPVPGC